MIFTHFYIVQGKQLETWLVLPANRKYFGTEPRTILSTNWQRKHYSLVKWNSKFFFFIVAAIKIAVSMNCCSTPFSFGQWFAALNNFSKGLL